MDYNDEEYNITNEQHQEYIANLFNNHDAVVEDFVFVCENGEQVFTNKYMIMLHSPLIRDMMKDVPKYEVIAINVPFALTDIEHMLWYLNVGEVKTQSKYQLDGQ